MHTIGYDHCIMHSFYVIVTNEAQKIKIDIMNWFI